MNTTLQDRLSALRIEVAPDVQARHLDRIAAALVEPPAPRRVRAAGVRRRAAVIAGAVVLVGTPAAAVAAEGSIPGDLLYPVKQATELVRSWFDDTIAADHRIDELEVVIDRRAARDVVMDRLRDAEDAVSELDDPDVTARLDRVRDRASETAPGSDEAPSRDRSGVGTPTTTVAERPTDAATTTTTAAPPPERPGDSDGQGSGGSTDDPPTDRPPRGDRGNGGRSD